MWFEKQPRGQSCFTIIRLYLTLSIDCYLELIKLIDRETGLSDDNIVESANWNIFRAMQRNTNYSCSILALKIKMAPPLVSFAKTSLFELLDNLLARQSGKLTHKF